MSSRVLVFSRDPMLLETRQLILEAFFQVRGAATLEDAEALLAMGPFDLIILCSTLSEPEFKQIFEVVEFQKRQPQILIVSALGWERLPHMPDHVHSVEPGPYQLLKRSAEILGVDLEAPGLVGV